MKFRTTLLSFATLCISFNLILADEDKEEARPEVRLAEAKKTLLSSSNISLVYVKAWFVRPVPSEFVKISRR